MILKKLFNNALFGETMENLRKDRVIKLATTERRKNYLASEPNKLSYYDVFHGKFISNKNEKNWNTYEKACLFRTFNARIK